MRPLGPPHPHRFRHTLATWAIELHAREIDVQVVLGHSTPAMLRRHTATYDAEKAAQAHTLFSPADRLKGRLKSQRSGPASCLSEARFHPDSTPVSPPVFESKGLTIRPVLRGDLLPSKQVVAGSIPVSRPSHPLARIPLTARLVVVHWRPDGPRGTTVCRPA
jgi:hypothetical protein